MIDKYQAWRKTKRGSIIGAAAALVLVIIFGSWAIDSGSLWHYGLAFFFVFDAILSFANIFRVQSVKPNAKKRRIKKTA